MPALGRRPLPRAANSADRQPSVIRIRPRSILVGVMPLLCSRRYIGSYLDEKYRRSHGDQQQESREIAGTRRITVSHPSR